jgi:hypothetical protein
MNNVGHTQEQFDALEAFAKAVDAAVVFEWGSRESHPCGESIGEISADTMSDEDRPKVRKIQKARDDLVKLGILKAVR